jgi:hypothetical protein
MDEAALLEKLRRIDALFVGATTDGERVAPSEAKKRIELRLERAAKLDPPVEYRFTLADDWSRKLFLALLRRSGITPYRYKGQRRTTVVAKVSKRFVDETLWPEFQQLADALRKHLAEITDRVVATVLHEDGSDPNEVPEPPKLGPGAEGGESPALPSKDG